MYYDNYTYTVQPTDTNQFYPQPIQVNLPVLKATIEYEGDANAVAPGGDNEIVKPVVCVTNFTFTGWSGAVHTFGQPYHAASECNTEAAGFQNGGGYDVLPEMESDDSSFYRLDLSNFSDFTVTDAQGTVYHFTDNSCAESLQYYPNAENNGIYSGGELGSANTRSCGILAIPSSIVDKNGNTITISGGSGNFFRGLPVTITDTLGRSITVQSNGFSYKDSSGTTQSVKVTEIASQSAPVPAIGPPATSYICSLNEQQGPPPFYPQITLAGSNGFNSSGASTSAGFQTTWEIDYASTGKKIDMEMDGYNHLLKITYPSGGYSRYDWQELSNSGPTGPVSCNWWNVGVAHRYECASSSGQCASEYVTTYDYAEKPGRTTLCQYPVGSGLGPIVTAMTVTDPYGTDTVHCYTPNYWDGSNTKIATYTFDSQGNEIKSVTYDYTEPGEGQNGASGESYGSFNFPSTITTTIGSLTSKVYRQYSEFQLPIVLFSPNLSKSETYNYYYPAPAETIDYGFDGNIAKQTDNAYWSYLADNILDELQSSTVTDPSSGNTATTSYTFDSIGNIESKTLSGTNAVTQSYTYTPLDAYGRPSQDVDGLGNTTKFSYSDADGWADTACAPASGTDPYLTEVTNAVGQSTYYKYYSCTGLLASVSKPNGNTVSYAYDSLGRLTSVSNNEGGSIQYQYTDSAPNSIQTTLAISADTNKTTDQILDGLARTSQIRLTSAPSSYIYTDITYDALGRIASISNAYQSTSDATYGLTKFYYDALSRKTEQIDADGNKQWWCYDGTQDVLHPQPNCRGNVSSFSAGTWVDRENENGSDWQDVSDVRGNLRAVIEPGTLETDYSYDTFGNLLSVNQKGASGNAARTRTFTYNGLSQLITSTNPETGSVCYGTWSGSSCVNGYDADGNVLSKTDARGITTNYKYDALNRLTQKSYSDGTSADPTYTPLSCYEYDVSSSAFSGFTPSNLVGRLSNEWTQPSGTSCGTAPVSGGYITLDTFSYDPMGRVKTEEECTPANCTASTPYSMNYTYDLAGDMLTSTNGLESTPGTTVPQPLTFTYTWNGAQWLQGVTSNWSTTNPDFPPQLMSVQSFIPTGAVSTMTYGNGLTLNRTYDNRLRITGETDQGSTRTSQTPGTATITIMGADQSQ